MDDNNTSRLEFFRSQIGQSLSKSISPFGRWLNGTILAVDYGRLVIEFLVREELTNPAGILHGGASAAILDDLVGTMVFSLGRPYAYTSVNLSVDYLHAARIDSVVTATAELIREGKNIIHCEGRIESADGKIIAKCATNLIQTSVKLDF
ncbi:PaaI family thioesterase [Spirosoma daeguense]